MAALLTIVLGACKEDFNEGIVPQTNPQETSQTYEGLTVELGDDFKQALDLSQFPSTGSLVAIKTNEIPEIKEEASIEYAIEVASTVDFTDKIQIEIGAGDELGVEVLDIAFRELFGKSPKARDLNYRFLAYIKESTSRVRFGDYLLAGTVNVLPIPMDLPNIEDAYYMIGNMTGWDAADASTLLKFEHSGADVYDDPIFTIAVKVSEPEQYWKIVTQSAVDLVAADATKTFWDGITVGSTVDGDTSAEGKLTSKDPQALKFEEKGKYIVTINMMDETFSVVQLPPVDEAYYMIGNLTGWNSTDATTLLKFNHSDLDVYDDPIFTMNVETTEPDQYWKIIPQATIDAVANEEIADFWAGQVFGSAVDGDDSPSGSLVYENANALKLSAVGKYLITLNMSDLTFKVELLPDVSIISVRGDYTGWDWVKSQKLYSIDGNTFTGTIYFDGKAANGWKICYDPDWKESWGGNGALDAEASPITLDGGDNLAIYAKNCYKFEYIKATKVLTVVNSYDSWGVVGAHNAWGGSPDVAMTYGSEEVDGEVLHFLTATLDLEAAAPWKLRADNAWASEVAPAHVTGSFIDNGDGNFRVDEAGNYTIKWYFSKHKPTLDVIKN